MSRTIDKYLGKKVAEDASPLADAKLILFKAEKTISQTRAELRKCYEREVDNIKTHPSLTKENRDDERLKRAVDAFEKVWSEMLGVQGALH